MPRGFKICPSCDEPCGPRSLDCKKCGAPFLKKEVASQPLSRKTDVENKKEICDTKKKQTSEGSLFFENLILTPGKHKCDIKPFCPYKLKGSDETSVLEWLEDMKNTTVMGNEGLRHRYSRSAILYMVGTFYNPNSSEYATVRGIIVNNMEEYPNV